MAKKEFEIIVPTEADFTGEKMITRIKADRERDMKVELPWPVPANDEEAKEFYGPNASIAVLVKKGVQVVSHGPDYQGFWKDFMKEGLNDEDAANRLFAATVQATEIDAPRQAGAPSKKTQDKVITALAKQNGISYEEMLARINGAAS